MSWNNETRSDLGDTAMCVLIQSTLKQPVRTDHPLQQDLPWSLVGDRLRSAKLYSHS